jgi:purine catabolism regulator
MLTVREALSLPVFHDSLLVAGESGIDNVINWVHIVDIPEAHYEWHRRGVLLLTAGYGLRDHPDRLEALIPTLVEQGFAGMVLAVGYNFDRAPDALREAADRLAFPLIEAPREILFIEVTEAILERIVNRQYTLLQQSSAVSEQLTELVLQGANLDGLVATLASLIGRSVLVEDASFRIVASAQAGPVDQARLDSVARGRTAAELSQRLVDAGIYAQLQSRLGPVHLPPLPELGMDMERLVTPIIVDREIHGYLWVIIDDQPVSQLDERAISHAATVAALIIFKDLAVRRAEEAQRGDLLERLLQGPPDSVAIGDQALRLRFRPDRAQQVLVIRSESGSRGSPQPLLASVETWLSSTMSRHLAAWRGNQLVVVLENGRERANRDVALALHKALNHPGSRLLIGVGRPCSAEEVRQRGIRRSYEEALEAIQIAEATGVTDGVMVFEELGLLHWLYHLPPERLSESVFSRAVDLLAAHDAERNAELVKSLDAFLEHNGSLVDTAQALYIHRNTLLHRLERIRALTGLDLRTAWQRANLYMALKAHQLQRYRSRDTG